MSLDYSAGCVNFRDVGEFVNLIAGSELIPQGRLYRCGLINDVQSLEELGSPRSIISLRTNPDAATFPVDYYHFPIPNTFEVYNTADPSVRRVLKEIMQQLADTSLQLPVLIHCYRGKDRTGVVVAALLKALGIPDEVIIGEYMLSEGLVQQALIEGALSSIGNVEQYVNRVPDLNLVRKNFLVNPTP